LFDRVTLAMMKVNKVEKGKIWNDKKEEEEGGKNLGTDAATSIVHPVALSCHTNSDGYTSAAYLGRMSFRELGLLLASSAAPWFVSPFGPLFGPSFISLRNQLFFSPHTIICYWVTQKIIATSCYLFKWLCIQ
jgi:hypothetical protein